MKVYTIIGGVNGVGKSSFAGVLNSVCVEPCRVVDVDSIIADLEWGNYTGCKEAIRRIDDAFKKGLSLVQETTMAGHRIERTARKAREAGYEVRLYYIGLDTASESLDRIQNRVRRGGHDVAPECVLRRFERRWEAVERVLPYCDVAEFYDNENGFVRVAEFVDGELVLREGCRCRWVVELDEYLKRRRMLALS